jgi:hypothetical protein
MSTNRQLGTRVPAAYDRDRTPGQHIDSGPHLAEVKDNADQLFHGRLRVYIPYFGGDPEDDKSWFTVNYASPFFGEVNPFYGQQKAGTEPVYGQTLHSYGMWFVPPDLGVNVLVTFVTGNPDLGYWFACIPTPRAHQMVPGIASSTNYVEKGTASKSDFPAVPVAEAVLDRRNDFLNNPRPVHKPQFDIISNQGIAADQDRGAITSSSQRESPSKVFGISTPGRPDPDPSLENDQVSPSTNFLKKIADSILNNDSTLGKSMFKPVTRKGGHSLVMDDGDKAGSNQLLRLRSATGHQIMMNDTAGIIYVINAAGTSWIEMTPDGSINVFSSGSVSMRARGSMNFHADQDIKFHAGGNITAKSGNSLIINSEDISIRAESSLVLDGDNVILASNGSTAIHGDSSLVLGSGGDLMIMGAVQIVDTPGSKPGSGVKIDTKPFPEPTKRGSVWKVGGNTTESTVNILPTHEPWGRPAGQINKKSVQQAAAASEDDNLSPNTSTNRAAVSAAAVKNRAQSPDTKTTGTGGTGTGGTTESPAPSATDSSKNVIKPNSEAQAKIPKGSRITPELVAKQVDPPGTLGNLSALETKTMYAQLGLRESGLRYNIAGGRTAGGEYTGNFLGKYQLGAEALVQAGYIHKSCLTNEFKGRPTYAVQSDSCWTGKNGVNSKTDYLNNPAAQEDGMHEFTKGQYKILVANGTIKSSDSSEEVMGKLTAAHLIGVGGASKLFKTGVDSNDALGTSGQSYYELGRHASNVASNMEHNRVQLAQNKPTKTG